MKTEIAIAPKTFVKTNWPMLPTPIATTPTILRFGERKNTLPPYSPKRFGVKTAHVNPQKTDSMASHKLIGSIDLINRCHFTASNPQFNNIKTPTTERIVQISIFGIAFNNETNFFKSLLAISFI